MDNNQTYNFEAEQAILGAIIHDATALDRIAWLEPNDFAHPRNRTLFSYFRYLYENEMPIEIAFVAENMKDIGKPESEIMDMIMYFTKLSGQATTTGNIERHATIVSKRALRRKVSELGAELQNASTDEYGADTDVITNIEKKLDAIRPRNKTGGLRHIAKGKEKFFDHMTAPDDFIKTGSKAFDDWGGGYANKSLIIKAGRPGVGKTAQVLQDVRGIVENNPGVAAIFSQEMDENQVTQRLISCKSGINYTRIRRKWVMQDEQERLKFEQAHDEITKLPLYINDASGMSIQEVRAECRRLQREVGKIAVIMLDYLTLLKITVPKGSTRPAEIGQVVWQCKQMAKEFDCPFILICMMGRSGEGTAEPKLSDLKESGDIEQHADMVEFLWLDPSDTSNGKEPVVTRTIAKGRDTGPGKLKYIFKGYCQRFVDFVPKEKTADEKNRK